ncbi:MAG TPA: hypothetical protein VEX15_22995 [Nocardioidaceae bacterium]|nr:hypothetical protein [Nocardioidaceae bacterium]
MLDPLLVLPAFVIWMAVCATRAKSPTARAVAKVLCIASALVTVLGAALLWWFFANFELAW